MTPRARRRDPVTSHLAALTAKNRHTAAYVLAILDVAGPCTDQDIERYYWEMRTANRWHPVSSSGLRTRRHELVVDGIVADTGERARIASGRWAVVWAAVTQ